MGRKWEWVSALAGPWDPRRARVPRRWRHSRRPAFRRAFGCTRALPRTRPARRQRTQGVAGNDCSLVLRSWLQRTSGGSWLIYRSTLFRSAGRFVAGITGRRRCLIVGSGLRTPGATSPILAASICRCDILLATVCSSPLSRFPGARLKDANSIRSGPADAGAPRGYA